MTPLAFLAALRSGDFDGAMHIGTAIARAEHQRRAGYPDRAAVLDDYAAEVALVCGGVGDDSDDDADGGMAAELRRVVA